MVLDILNKASKSVDKANVLVYRVIFEERSIEIIASFDIFEKVKKSLLAVTQVENSECQICTDTLRTPYRFINCSCIFCWHCIAEYMREFYSSGDSILLCPGSSCLQ